MSGSLGVVAFIVTLLVMIVFHEFGHFLAARRFGIKVDEFFVGFGPRIWSRKRGETEYGLKAVLIGGYVKISGMNPWQTVPDSELPRTFGAKPAWQRAIVLTAGSATHFVLAAVVLFTLFAFVGLPGDPTTTLSSVEARVTPPEGFIISGAASPSPATIAGFRRGDRVIEVAGVPVSTWEQMSNAIRSHPAETIEVVVVRRGDRAGLRVTPVSVSGKDAKGTPVTVGLIGITPKYLVERRSIPRAAGSAVYWTGRITKDSLATIGRVFSPKGIGTIFAALSESGQRGQGDPIGIVGGARVAGQAASAGRIQALLWILTGFIVIVGVVNLVPLPPLDGGHLLVLVIEKIRRKKVDLRKVVPVAMLVLGFLIFLQMALLYLDIFRPTANPFQ